MKRCFCPYLFSFLLFWATNSSASTSWGIYIFLSFFFLSYKVSEGPPMLTVSCISVLSGLPRIFALKCYRPELCAGFLHARFFKRSTFTLITKTSSLSSWNSRFSLSAEVFILLAQDLMFLRTFLVSQQNSSSWLILELKIHGWLRAFFIRAYEAD